MNTPAGEEKDRGREIERDRERQAQTNRQRVRAGRWTVNGKH